MKKQYLQLFGNSSRAPSDFGLNSRRFLPEPAPRVLLRLSECFAGTISRFASVAKRETSTEGLVQI